MKRLPLGAMSISVSKLPAGTVTISAVANGSADPQTAQKLRAWRVPGSLKVVIEASPESQVSVAVKANKLAACELPVSLRQCAQ